MKKAAIDTAAWFLLGLSVWVCEGSVKSWPRLNNMNVHRFAVYLELSWTFLAPRCYSHYLLLDVCLQSNTISRLVLLPRVLKLDCR